jgi:hypothetical protein
MKQKRYIIRYTYKSDDTLRSFTALETDDYDEATAYINENASDKLDGEDYELIDNQIK